MTPTLLPALPILGLSMRVAALALCAILAACGGAGEGGVGSTTSTTGTTAIADKTAEKLIGPSGGTLEAASAGVVLTVEVPPNAVATQTRFAIVPELAADGAAVSFRVLPADVVFAQAVTATLKFPQGTDLSGTVLRLGSGEGRFSVAAMVDQAQHMLVARISSFAGLSAAPKPALLLTLAQLRQRIAEVPADGSELLTAEHRQTLQTKVAEARVRLAALQRDKNFAAAYALQNSVSQVLQLRGEDGYAASAEPFIAGARATACDALAAAISDAMAAQFTQSGQYVALVKPILYWEAAAQRLGGDACPGTPYQEAINAIMAREKEVLRSKLAAAYSPDDVSKELEDVVKARELKVEVNALQQSPPPAQNGIPLPTLLLGPLATALQTEVIEPALVPARQAAWDARRETGEYRHYINMQRAFGLLPALENDIQYGATRLIAKAQDAQGQAQRIVAMGLDPNARAPATAVRTGAIGLPANGRLAWSGDIAALNCPSTAQEQIVIALDGVEVHRQSSVGASLLSRNLTLPSLTAGQLMAAIQLPASDAQPHTLTIRRLSSCLSIFGITDDLLFTLSVQFNAPEPALKPFEECMFVNGGVLPVFPVRADFITIGPISDQGRQFNVINLGENYRSEFNVVKYQTYIQTDALSFNKEGTPYSFDFRFDRDIQGRRKVTGTVTVYFPTSGNPPGSISYDAICDLDLLR